MNTPLLQSPDAIPLYREGASDEASWQRLQADPAGFFARGYEHAGSIYRTWFGEGYNVVLAGLEANDFCWRNPDLWTYHEIMAGFREQLGDDHVTALDGAPHRQKRGILKPAYDQAAFMRLLPEYLEYFEQELATAALGDPIDLVEFWNQTITKANGRILAHVQYTAPELAKLLRWQRELLRGLFLPEEARHAFYAAAEYVGLWKHALAFLGRVVDARLAEPERYDDTFAAVLRNRADKEGGQPDRDRLIDDLYLLLFAGIENTSRLINRALVSIWDDPAWLAELRAELDTWDGRDAMALSRLSKLKATIMETQRLYPLTNLTRRQPTRDFTFQGYQLPAGVLLYQAITVCHFLDEIYAQPLAFRPQRFVENGQFAPKTFGFFGGGVHICLGRNQALLQSPIALALTLKHYELDYAASTDFLTMARQPGQLLNENPGRLIRRAD